MLENPAQEWTGCLRTPQTTSGPVTGGHAEMPVEWNALFAACNLFRETAKSVGAHFGYDYPAEDDRRVSEHLKRVRGTAEHIAERCR